MKKGILICILSLLGILCVVNQVQAAFLDSPYITFSPDGQAFTTNADEADTEWYPYGYTLQTGNTSTLEKPGVGEHWYPVMQSGTVRVSRWEVQHAAGRCTHIRYTDVTNFHGVYFDRNICNKSYYSGWLPYCADCGELAVEYLIYMSKEAAASIKELDMSLAYYYRCPHCTHLEQGIELGTHVCKGISANQYSVRYHANMGRGYMPKSVHMYNNATLYEGKEITPQKNLTRNSFVREGYEFVGWNTAIDGSGRSFADGAEIWNLCTEEQESIILYAQWKRSRSTLKIDPAGGLYKGQAGVTAISGDYGSQYDLEVEKISPPMGSVIHFDTNGGEVVADMAGKKIFSEWSLKQPFYGTLHGQTYTFKGQNGAIDCVRAVYKDIPVILPECRKEGASFGGWYFDKEGTRPAGGAGTEFLAAQDTTLYAQWVDLRLEARDNYRVNNGAGAVDLSWEQKDNVEKTYLIYQKQEGGDWKKIHSAEEILTEKQVYKTGGFTGSASVYRIPYSGYYRVTIQGAQGADYGSFRGGKGGQVSAVIYFEKGEEVRYEVGGQNGYNGGGSAEAFGNGGGMTDVSTAERGILLIAGGGGGAVPASDGGAGGSQAVNTQDGQGQSGAAGGGGGYKGGTAGNAVVHKHDGSCTHIHTGTPATYGGCYTAVVFCGGTEYESSLYYESFYYGNVDNNGNTILCVRCDSYICPGHKDSVYKYTCCSCNETYYGGEPDFCTTVRYGLGCGREDGIDCGYANGEVLGATMAYGGSNYVKEGECLTYEEQSGVQSGNGAFAIESVQIGFSGGNSLKGVTAADFAPPDSISQDTVKIKAVDENKVNVVFERPTDRGTTYYHIAESYSKKTGSLVSTSNQTVNTLISGISGYYYRVDEKRDTNITKQDHFYKETGEDPYISVTVTEENRYLHIAAVDKAGNLSGTMHIPVSSKEVIFWPVITEQIRIREGDNVYPYGDMYYVKADGTTAFEVSFDARLCGTATPDYQINHLEFEAQNISVGQESGRLHITVPAENVMIAGSCLYRNERLSKQYENVFCLTDASFTEVRRSNYCKHLNIIQSFTIPRELDNCRLQQTPHAGAEMGNVKIESDETMDAENSICLIADGSGPMISGLEIPQGVMDAEDGKWEYTLQVSARDEGSGLKDFWLEIRNRDSGAYEKIRDTDEDGLITIFMSPQNPLFGGKFTILARAQDYVGNESSETYGMDAITVEAYIEKLLDPQEDTYKKGESAILHIQTTGYVEKVEVIFPQEWLEYHPGWNRTFIYDTPSFMQTEKVEFTIPFKVPEGKYIIEIQGYKGDRRVNADPKLFAIDISGSVLDEIRTRLR